MSARCRPHRNGQSRQETPAGLLNVTERFNVTERSVAAQAPHLLLSGGEADHRSHEILDALPAHRTRDYFRGLLVEHGALPRRDERRARYEAWAAQALQRLPEGENREITCRFIRWHMLRRMNTMPPVSEGTFLRSKQTVTVAINFLTWLDGRGLTLGEVAQADLDAWQAGGPTTRELVSRFVGWAVEARPVSRDLTVTPHRRGTSPRLGAADQQSAVQRVIYGDELTPQDRLAAILDIVFAQQGDRRLPRDRPDRSTPRQPVDLPR